MFRQTTFSINSSLGVNRHPTRYLRRTITTTCTPACLTCSARGAQDVVRAVDAGIARRTLTVAHRTFDYCEPYADTKRTLVTDRNARVRMYERQAGSEDSALTFTHYYDDRERLRLVRIIAKKTRGTILLHRIYFDEAGKRIREDHSYIKGPRDKFPSVWPVEDLQLSAASAFASPSPCSEGEKGVK